ncbi:MAG TPA: flagellar biosynthetic protein FliR [Deltaproteobacteria bacterium]|nr:flagellar biosynthetic protein FliR [Deltaproteobacteria bacterium]
MKELLSIAWPDMISFVFVFVRIGIIFAMLPFFGTEIMPRRIIATIAFFLSLVIMPVVPPARISLESLNIFSFGLLLVHELLIGLCLGLSVNVITAGSQIAGQIIGFQIGFAIANVVDPMTGEDAPITSNILYVTTFLLFLSLGGHHMLIKALMESFYVIPIEASLPRQGYLVAAMSYSAKMFIIAMKMAAPVIGVLLLMNISFGLVARAIPQMNVFIMSFPLTISVGLIFTVIVIKLMPHVLSISLGDAWVFMKSSLALF